MQSRVFSFVDDAHPSTAQHLYDPVVGNSLAYHGPSGGLFVQVEQS
jgi:hypothetical protein